MKTAAIRKKTKTLMETKSGLKTAGKPKGIVDTETFEAGRPAEANITPSTNHSTTGLDTIRKTKETTADIDMKKTRTGLDRDTNTGAIPPKEVGKRTTW